MEYLFLDDLGTEVVLMKRVVLVTNIPTPYRIPLFNELSRQLSEVGAELIVIFGSDTYERRKWVVDLSNTAFDYHILQSSVIGAKDNSEITTFTYSGLTQLLKRLNPDLVISPGFSLATMKIWRMSFTHRFKYVIWTGSVAQDQRYSSLPRYVQRKMLAWGAAAVVVYGSAARAYMKKLGVKPNKIFVGINTVDTTYFARQTEAIRSRLPASNMKYLTYVGYLSRRKKVSDLVKKMICLAGKRDDFVFEIIGDGEELPVLRSLVKVNNLESRIVFHGYRQKNELPRYLARSNGFLFQTGFDIWGLVLNEAMAAGVPCVASKNACAVHDLLKGNDAGFVVDYSDYDNLLELVEWLLDNPGAGNEIGAKARSFIEKHVTLEHSAAGFVQAIQHSLGIQQLAPVPAYDV